MNTEDDSSRGNIDGLARILFVDDEETISSIAGEMFALSGHYSRIFNCPLKALEHFKENSADYNIVVTDQVMPEMDGMDFILGVRELRPELPAVLCTGSLINERRLTEMTQPHRIVVVNKPYSFNELVEIVRANALLF